MTLANIKYTIFFKTISFFAIVNKSTQNPDNKALQNVINFAFKYVYNHT